MKNTAKAEPEVVAKRRTSDGAVVNFHADGQVSFVTYFLRTRLPLSIMWKVAGDVCLYDAAELPALLRKAKAGDWRPFRVSVPAPSTAIYKEIKNANGLTTYIRIVA